MLSSSGSCEDMRNGTASTMRLESVVARGHHVEGANSDLTDFYLMCCVMYQQTTKTKQQ